MCTRAVSACSTAPLVKFEGLAMVTMSTVNVVGPSCMYTQMLAWWIHGGRNLSSQNLLHASRLV